jgi:hypothetical protein
LEFRASDSLVNPLTSTPENLPRAGGSRRELQARRDREREYMKYLCDTKRVVARNSSALTTTVADVMSLLVTQNDSAIVTLFPPDEAASPSDASELTALFPQVLDSQLLPTVNIYSVRQATVYVVFIVVRCEDAGVVSQHTFGVPLRFIDGRWCLSSIDLNTPGLTFVQTVRIPSGSHERPEAGS